MKFFIVLDWKYCLGKVKISNRPIEYVYFPLNQSEIIIGHCLIISHTII